MVRRLLGILTVLETNLKKNDAGYYKSLGDGIAKIKIDQRMKSIDQINALYHEYTHFIFGIFRFMKKKKRISDREEEDICYEIGDKVARIFGKHFKEER